MAFSTKRGRPKKAHGGRQQDFGTPELQKKRRQQGTMEALDLLFAAQQITPAQHRAGMHFRWLYTLCHGTPLPAALNLCDSTGGTARQDDPHWREDREKEYREAAAALQAARRIRQVLDCCVFHELPRGVREIDTLREGLDILVALWRYLRHSEGAFT